MRYDLDDLLYLMARLRDPKDGCPWDLQQDFSSIVPHTLEESYELADAIYNEDYPQIKEELGDVLFQVIFYAQLGAEKKAFEFAEVVNVLVDKLVRRHPHVFPDGDLKGRTSDKNVDIQAIKANWETIKSEERTGKQLTSVLDDVPIALPALNRASKLQKRASQVGFDWENADDVLERLRDEIEELLEARDGGCSEHIEDELGDVLFSTVNLARHLKVNPVAALQKANRKFEKRFRYIEKSLLSRDSSLEEASLETMDALWDEAKENGL